DSPPRARTKREQRQQGPMTSPRAARSTADRTYVRRRNWAGEPTLLLGENARGYDELLAEGLPLAGCKRIAQGRSRYFPQTKPSSANEANVGKANKNKVAR